MANRSWMSGRCRAAARARASCSGWRPSPQACCSHLALQPVQERGGVQRRPAGRGDREREDGLQDIGVVGGRPGAAVDHLVQQHGQVAGRQVPQRQPGLVGPDRHPPGARPVQQPPGAVRLDPGVRVRPCSPARSAAAAGPRPARAASRAAVNQPAHSRIIRLVFPLPVAPTTTMCRAHAVWGRRTPGASGARSRGWSRRPGSARPWPAAGRCPARRSGPWPCGPGASTAGRRT